MSLHLGVSITELRKSCSHWTEYTNGKGTAYRAPHLPT